MFLDLLNLKTLQKKNFSNIKTFPIKKYSYRVSKVRVSLIASAPRYININKFSLIVIIFTFLLFMFKEIYQNHCKTNYYHNKSQDNLKIKSPSQKQNSKNHLKNTFSILSFTKLEQHCGSIRTNLSHDQKNNKSSQSKSRHNES